MRIVQPMLHEEIYYRIFRFIEAQPNISQRQLIPAFADGEAMK